MEIDSALRASPLFRDLEPADRRAVAAISRLTKLHPGGQLCREGEPAAAIYCIVSGRIKVLRTLASGKEVILAVLGPGDPVGAVAAYAGRPYPASAEALEETICLETRTAALLALLERRPTLVRALMQAFSRRLVELSGRFTELAGEKCEIRLAFLFLRLADHLGRPAEGGTWIPLALQRQDLADLTGMTSETCIRIMSLWDQRGILRTEADGFLLLDRDALEARARA